MQYLIAVFAMSKCIGDASKESGKSLCGGGLVRTSFIFHMELRVREAHKLWHRQPLHGNVAQFQPQVLKRTQYRRQ